MKPGMIQIIISVLIIVYGIYYVFNCASILKRKYEKEDAKVPEGSEHIARIVGVVFIVIGAVLLIWNLVRYYLL